MNKMFGTILKFILLLSLSSLPYAYAEDSVPSTLTELSTSVVMPESYINQTAKEIYFWGWPLVNQYNRRESVLNVPLGRLNGIVPVAPIGNISMLNDYVLPEEDFVTCPNQDVVYGAGFFSLDEQPVVMQVPDFQDRFWVYAIYDIRTDQFGEIGKPYDTQPGFYLLVGPNWKGEVPSGITKVIVAPTSFANAIPRIFMNDTDEDRRAIQSLVNQVVAYPLSEFDGSYKTIDWSKTPSIPGPKSEGKEKKWVVPDTFFKTLKKVMLITPPLQGEEIIYAKVNQFIAMSEKDPAFEKLLNKAANEAEGELITPLFKWEYNGVPIANGWNIAVDNADFKTNYYQRTAIAKSNMYVNRSAETKYFYAGNDSNHNPLNGKYNYVVTFKPNQTPPVKGFWSLTLYNKNHLFSPNPLNRYSLGTKNKSLKFNDDGSLTIYVGTKSPGKDKESNWLPSPAGEFSLFIRAYWPEEAVLDKSWHPPTIVKN